MIPAALVTDELRRRVSFPTTRITLIEAACGEPGTEAHEAVSILCGTYWYPIYAYIRRLGHPQDDAEDLTQGFFTRVLEKHYLRDFQRERGRFRSFLLAALKHFIANERDWARTQKRGGARATVPLDDVLRTAERRYSLEPRHDLTPDKVFERQWALALLAHVEEQLHAEAVSGGSEAQFSRLKPFLAPDDRAASYRELAVVLQTTEGAIKVAVHRLRQRFRELLREEISRTVADPADVGDELRHLMAAIRT
jgi:DNA-directed RNA polymerase specialized sigma24 family protein